jgi:hypothetical protein
LEPQVGKTRTCAKCGFVGIEGPDFYPGHGNRCKACAKAYEQAYRARQRDERTEVYQRKLDRDRHKARAKKYGITEEESRRLHAVEACQICGCGIPENSGRALNVDHCHVTGAVRGVLCNRCNRGLGFFLDDPALLRAAADYLESAGARP